MHYANENISSISRFINIFNGFEWKLKYISKDCLIFKVAEYFSVAKLVAV